MKRLKIARPVSRKELLNLTVRCAVKLSIRLPMSKLEYSK